MTDGHTRVSRNSRKRSKHEDSRRKSEEKDEGSNRSIAAVNFVLCWQGLPDDSSQSQRERVGNARETGQ